jgi:hypothetical protein
MFISVVFSYFAELIDALMKRLLLFCSILSMAFTAVADRVVVFNPADVWPVPVTMETGLGPMPLGYYTITLDDVEVEFEIDEEMENEHDAYYYRGKMNIYSPYYGIKKVSFTCRQMAEDASFTLLYEHNYNYTQNNVGDDGMTTVFEFFDTYREYVGLEGMADILTIAVTLDDEDPTSVPEALSPRTVASVRYFNTAGQELQQPSGLFIRLTTYSDGSTSVEKCVK